MIKTPFEKASVSLYEQLDMPYQESYVLVLMLGGFKVFWRAMSIEPTVAMMAVVTMTTTAKSTNKLE